MKGCTCTITLLEADVSLRPVTCHRYQSALTLGLACYFDFQPVLHREAYAKCGTHAGYRKQVKVDGVDVLLLWYKNKIYAIEAR